MNANSLAALTRRLFRDPPLTRTIDATPKVGEIEAFSFETRSSDTSKSLKATGSTARASTNRAKSSNAYLSAAQG